ncbi:MAG: DNA repair protein RecN [Pseudomonadota bacterium]
MLEEIAIRNFAVMDDAHALFGPGLTAVTGETGAGKSILVNAVALLLGARATARMIREGAESAEITARFAPPEDSEAWRELSAQGMDLSEGLVIRRVIAANDRHRVYVNGRPSTMAEVTRLTEGLAGISGQHAHQALLRPEAHLEILDRFGNLLDLREEVGQAHQATARAWARVRDLAEGTEKARQEREFREFEAAEIDRAEIQPNEDEALETEKRRVKNAEALFATAHGSEEALYSSPGACGELLSMAQKNLSEAARMDPALARPAESVAQALILVEDAAAELRDYLSGLEMEEGRLDALEARLHLLSGLKRKYGPSLAGVLERREELARLLEDSADREGAMARARKALDQEKKGLSALCARLSEKRKKAARDLEERVVAELSGLSMPGACFRVELAPAPAPRDPESPFALDLGGAETAGAERAAFLIAPNVGEGEKPLREIASGGELSRVVLAIKVILAKKDGVRTVIFDEVDAGIGGATADVVGEKLAALSATHQVVCITHLPHIARFADCHLRVKKTVEHGRTKSAMEALDDTARVEEIARMLAGEPVTPTSRRHAGELLASAAEKRRAMA